MASNVERSSELICYLKKNAKKCFSLAVTHKNSELKSFHPCSVKRLFAKPDTIYITIETIELGIPVYTWMAPAELHP